MPMAHINLVLLSDARSVAAYAIFVRSYFVFALGQLKADVPFEGDC
jgi:hypothetical protein